MILHVSLKATRGAVASTDLCSFYDEFGSVMKQASTQTETKKPVLTSPKPPEEEKESSLLVPPLQPPPPSPSPSPPQSPLPSSTPSTASAFPTVAPKESRSPLPALKVIWDYVNLREGPDTRYKIIGKAYRNNFFEVLDENSNWLRVRLENGTEGWMHKRAASGSSEPSSSQRSPASSYDSLKRKSPTMPHGPM